MGNNRARINAALPVLLVLLVAAGCSDGRPERVPVSGQVLIDGHPLAHGYVRFAPADSRAATGELDLNGRFVLTCFEPGDGAVPGKHKVTVMAHEPIGQETIKWHAPQKYASPSTSELEQEITGPTNSVKIELTWGGKRGPIIEHR